MTPHRKLEIHYEDEWAALYVDGVLDHAGGYHSTQTRALVVLGVTIVQDSAFMRGQNRRDGVAPTLGAVAEYAARRDADKAEAARLATEADRLLAEAARLDPTRKAPTS